jgi:Zinc-binding dehydrogenase
MWQGQDSNLCRQCRRFYRSHGRVLAGPVASLPGPPYPKRAQTTCRKPFDVAGKTPVEELIGLAPTPSQVVSIANYAAGKAGARVTGGGADSRPTEALAQVADLLEQNKLVLKVQTFPFDRAAEAYRISQSGHVRGKLVLVP